MAGVTGLEPATSGVTGQRSNQLSYTPTGCLDLFMNTKHSLNGGRYWARTSDPLLVRQVLSQLS